MKERNEIERSLFERGHIVWCPELECPECHRKGTFYGDDLEYGEFYECAFARYCPACQMIYDITEGRNFAPYGSEKFLPIMKNRLLINPETFDKPHLTIGSEFRPGSASLTINKKSCPVCGGDTYTFHKDLGGIDYYDNYWTVCANTSCDWPGEHRETYEPGPY
jgi:hypothetical protein